MSEAERIKDASNIERLRRRLAGAAQAREVFGLLTLEDGDAINGFVDAVLGQFRPNETEAAKAERSRARLSELAAVTLPRGIHADKRLDDVPREYLHWWIRDGEEWAEKIAAYLAATKHLDGENG